MKECMLLNPNNFNLLKTKESSSRAEIKRKE